LRRGGVETQDKMSARLRWQRENAGNAGNTGNYQNYLDNFDRGEYTPNERQQTPMYDQFQAPEGSDLPTYTPGADLPQYNAQGNVPEYNAQGYVPGYNSTGQFNFNLENDPIYQFQLEEGLKAATRQANASNMSNSGGILDELQKRGTGIAGAYQDAAFQRQLAGSRENYGRGVQDYGIDAARGRELYNRGAQDYGINAARDREVYGRGVQDYGINADRNNTMFNRNISNYGIDTDRANQLYGRGVGEYGMDVSRNQDLYGRDQQYLNRLSALASGGQNAAAQLGGYGSSAAANAGQLGMQGGLAEANQWQGINNAVQGSIANYLTHDLYSNNPYLMGGAYTGMGNPYNSMNSFGGGR
jgi:hypothetical protein